MARLSGKSALVTGGNSGIGLAVARRFAAEGARVFVTGRRQAQLDDAVRLIGGDAEAVRGDVTSAADLARLFDTIGTRAGKLDILVTSSGVSEPATIHDITADNFDRTFDLNVRGLVFTVQGALPLMGEGGAIVLIGSIAGSLGTRPTGPMARARRQSAPMRGRGRTSWPRTASASTCSAQDRSTRRCSTRRATRSAKR